MFERKPADRSRSPMSLILQCPEGQRLTLDASGLAVGGGADCAVALRGTGVPDRLALLVWEYGDAWLRVSAAEPPVAVNGRPVQSLARLHAGDRVCFGAFCIDLLGRQAEDDPQVDPIEAFVLRARGGGGSGAVLAGPVLHLDAGGEVVSAAAGVVALIRSQNRVELTAAADSARVNGWPVSGPVTLLPGDQLQIGARRFQLEVIATPAVDFEGSAPDESIEARSEPETEPTSETSESYGLWWLIALSALLAAAISALLYFRT